MPCVKLPSIPTPTQTPRSFNKFSFFSPPFRSQSVEISPPAYFQVLCNFDRINPSGNLQFRFLMVVRKKIR
jgi:hypothetical protein